MSYSGTTSLQTAIADLLDISVKSQASIALVTKQAKQSLGIDIKSRKLSRDNRLRVYQYIKAHHSPNNDSKTMVDSEAKPDKPKSAAQQPATATQPLVDINSQSVDKYSQQNVVKQLLEVTLKNNTIQHVKVINSIVENNSQYVDRCSQVDNTADVRVGFYMVVDGGRKRQVISLDGYFINALASIGILKADVPKWVQAQVDNWIAFDSKLPITRQAKYLIMREIVKGLSGSDSFFHIQLDD